MSNANNISKKTKSTSDQRFREVDGRVFNLKRKEHTWLKETNEDEGYSKTLSKTKKH